MDAQKIQGYDRIAYGHLAAAYFVVSGTPTRAWQPVLRPRPLGLDFIPAAQRALRIWWRS